MDGVGPADLRVESLIQRASKEACREVIFALPTTMEGDTTAFYLDKRLREPGGITTLARGVAVGDELQYADELTLIRSLQQRFSGAGQSGAQK